MKRFLAALLLASGTPAVADTKATDDPEMTCGSEPVRQALMQQLPALLCLNDNLKLDAFTRNTTVGDLQFTLADMLTTALTDIPLRRTCEAQLSFTATVDAEALGPGAGIAYRLLVTAEPRTLTYAVGRFDDGRLYVRPNGGCWMLDRLEPAP